MPYKSEYTKLKIPRELDRRVKLDLQEREEIKGLYGKISQRKLAAKFGVSRRLIIFIGCPEKHEQNLLRRKERGGSMIYYDRKKQIKASQKTREFRQNLYKQKKLEATK